MSTAAPGMYCWIVNCRNLSEAFVWRTSSRNRQLIPLLRKNLWIQSSFSVPVSEFERFDPIFQEPNLKEEGVRVLTTQACFSGRMGRRESARLCAERVSVANSGLARRDSCRLA